MVTKASEIQATGRRKTSTARVRLRKGDGKITVNGKDAAAYFNSEEVVIIASLPLKVTETGAKYDVVARVDGGGKVGQAGAVKLGIARALVLADETHKAALRAEGCLTRDPRERERKKSGQPGARKRFQFSKR
ncbi:MAG: 30S ribosomal protein S9 [Kiritimatiellia bacterium]